MTMPFRIGFGIDFHQLVADREFWIGGVKLVHHKGALGHSDADVLLHAICDALLGAACLGDIGFHFPDTSGEFKNIDSKILVAKNLPAHQRSRLQGGKHRLYCLPRRTQIKTLHSSNAEGDRRDSFGR